MGLPNIRTFTGATMAATGAGLAIVDAFRLANGDVSIFAGSSFAAAFATHAGLLTGGFGLMATDAMQEEETAHSSHNESSDQAQPALILVRNRTL